MDNSMLAVSHSAILTPPLKSIAASCEPQSAGVGQHTTLISPALTEGEGGREEAVPADLRLVVHELIHKYGLTREQFVAMYDECERLSQVVAEQAEEAREDQCDEPMNTADAEEKSNSLDGGGGGQADGSEQQQLQGGTHTHTRFSLFSSSLLSSPFPIIYIYIYIYNWNGCVCVHAYVMEHKM